MTDKVIHDVDCDCCGSDGEEETKSLREQIAERDQVITDLQREFNAYKETAEEIHQNYIYNHSDSWVFEQALRKIAEQGVELSDIAVTALGTVWKRRAERANRMNGVSDDATCKESGEG